MWLWQSYSNVCSRAMLPLLTGSSRQKSRRLLFSFGTKSFMIFSFLVLLTPRGVDFAFGMSRVIFFLGPVVPCPVKSQVYNLKLTTNSRFNLGYLESVARTQTMVK